MPETLNRVMKITDETYPIYVQMFSKEGCYIIPLEEIRNAYVVTGGLDDPIDFSTAPSGDIAWVEQWYIEDYYTLGPVQEDHFQDARPHI